MHIFKEIIQMYWFNYWFDCLEDYGLSLGFFVNPRDFLVQSLTLGSFKKLSLNICFNENSSESEKCDSLRSSHTLLKVQNPTASGSRNGLVIVGEPESSCENLSFGCETKKCKRWRFGMIQKWCLIWSHTFFQKHHFNYVCHLWPQLHVSHPYAGHYSFYIGIKVI